MKIIDRRDRQPFDSLCPSLHRSIPEAGYVTLGTLRYGVRLSSAGRYSACGSTGTSDSIDTCSVLVAPSSLSVASVAAATGRPGPSPLKAESPTCGNCCVGLTNGQCCDAGSPCFGNNGVQSHARNSLQQRPQFAKTANPQEAAMTPLKFGKPLSSL